jgi:hypothetical protein
MFSYVSKLVGGVSTSATTTNSTAALACTPIRPGTAHALARTASASSLHAHGNANADAAPDTPHNYQKQQRQGTLNLSSAEHAIQVAVRIRPTVNLTATVTATTTLAQPKTPAPKAQSHTPAQSSVSEGDEASIVVDQATATILDAVTNKTFTYDTVLPCSIAQEEVFTQCGAPMVDHVLAGHNGCILAYGQTGE